MCVLIVLFKQQNLILINKYNRFSRANDEYGFKFRRYVILIIISLNKCDIDNIESIVRD